MLRCLLGSLALMVAAGYAAQPERPPADLNEKTYTQWRDLIRPKSEELCFETVPWLPTLWEGVIEAQKQDKPILLWAMNGHPLACT